MADDDPYAKFLKPGGKPAAAPAAPDSTAPAAAPPDSDPFSKFVPSAKTVTTAPADKPSDVPWFSFGSQPDKIGEFVGKMADSASAGWGATALDKLGIAQGPSGQTVAQQIDSAGKDIGPVASGAADLAGYAVGPGKFALGERLAAKLGGGLAARVAGSAAENAGASVAGTTGHGDFNVGDNLRAAVIGGTVGAATGALPGAKGDLAPSATNSPTAGLQTATKQAFTPLESVKIDPGHIGPAFDGVTANLSSGMKTDMGDALTSATKKISGEMADKFRSGDTITADDIAKFQKTLGRAGNAPGAGPTDAVVAQQYSDALSRAVSRAQPTDWGNMAPGTDLADAIGAANKIGNQAKTSDDLDNWIKMAASKPDKVPDAVGKALDDNPQFYQTHPDLQPMLQDVANSKPGPWSKFAGKAGTMLGEAAIGAGAEYLGGQNPLVGGLAGLATGALTPSLGGKMRGSALATKLAQIRHLNATGQKLPTSSFAPSVPVLGPLGAYGRQAAPGIGASGAFAQPQTSGSP